jgi:hypothetical protein
MQDTVQVVCSGRAMILGTAPAKLTRLTRSGEISSGLDEGYVAVFQLPRSADLAPDAGEMLLDRDCSIVGSTSKERMPSPAWSLADLLFGPAAPVWPRSRVLGQLGEKRCPNISMFLTNVSSTSARARTGSRRNTSADWGAFGSSSLRRTTSAVTSWPLISYR